MLHRIKPMLAHEGKITDANNKYFTAEEKFDGTRVFLIKRGNEINIKAARSWKDYRNKFPEIISEARRLKVKDVILDGELTFFKRGKDVFLTIAANKETKKGFTSKYMVFDILSIGKKKTTNLPIEKRRKLIKNIVGNKLNHIQTTKVISGDLVNFFTKLTSDPRQAEGIMLKRRNSKYRTNFRSYDWLKLKKHRTEDCVVVGVTKGTGIRSKTFGALILAQYERGKLRYVAKASGFDNKELSYLFNKLKKMRINIQPLGIGRKILNVLFWTKPRIVVEIKYLEKTAYGVLRNPRFVRIRTDKSPKECKFSGGKKSEYLCLFKRR